MAKYKNLVVTNFGLGLLGSAHTGDTIQFTSIKTGNGEHTASENLAGLTDLKVVKQSCGVSSVSKSDATTVRVRCTISNDGLEEAYYIKEVGLYAKDPSTNTEKLYAIIVPEAGYEDYLPSYQEEPSIVTMDIFINVSNSAEGITFNALPYEGLFVTVEEFESYKASGAAVDSETREVVQAFQTAQAATNAEFDAAIKKNASDIASAAGQQHTHKPSDVGLGNVGNYKAVSTVAAQGLSSQEKENARRNIGLENVENKSSADIRSELTKENVSNAVGYTPANKAALDIVSDEVENKIESETANDFEQAAAPEFAENLNRLEQRIAALERNGVGDGSGSGIVIEGEKGKSAYELAVENGYSGSLTEWLASLKGEPGVPGTSVAGKTPVKGVDYFTESDKAELVRSIIEALPAAEEGEF